MLLDRIYKKVKTFVNTDVYGNVTPVEFERLVHDAIQSRYDEYFYDQNRATSRQNRGLIPGGLSNIRDRYAEKILHYYTESTGLTITDNKISIPDDLRYFGEIEAADNVSYEFCKTKREFNILKTQASVKYPLFTLLNNQIFIAPTPPATTTTVDINYLRKIKYPKWTYNLVAETELFNPDATDFVDADIHPSEEDEIVRRVLLRFGVNLKEADLQQYSLTEENQEFNQNNAT